MENEHKQVTTLGLLTKQETLKTLNHNILQNTFVVESLEPFPGYHGENLPSDSSPDSIYLVTSERYTTEKVFRLAKKISRFVQYDINAIPGEIVIYNSKYYCIRIRNLDSYEKIAELQNWFIDEGISFMKKKTINAPGLITLKKIFLLEKISNNIFKDIEDEHMYYVEIDSELSWSLFRKISETVKNNVDNRNFDAAKTYFYYNGITDYIRIYAKKPTVERLTEIQNRFNAEIKKYV